MGFSSLGPWKEFAGQISQTIPFKTVKIYTVMFSVENIAKLDICNEEDKSLKLDATKIGIIDEFSADKTLKTKAIFPSKCDSQPSKWIN